MLADEFSNLLNLCGKFIAFSTMSDTFCQYLKFFWKISFVEEFAQEFSNFIIQNSEMNFLNENFIQIFTDPLFLESTFSHCNLMPVNFSMRILL
jgi:hypothetical protein